MAKQKKGETINPALGQNSIERLESEFVKLESTVGVHGVMYELIEQTKVIYQKEIGLVYRDGYSEGYNRAVNQPMENPRNYFRRRMRRGWNKLLNWLIPTRSRKGEI